MKNLDVFVTNLIPINFIDSYKKKQLPLGMSFFKICKNFPKSEIGKMKSAQMHYEKDFIKSLIDDDVLSKSVLKKRSKTATRLGPYTKFLIKSLIETCAYQEDVKTPEFHDKSFTFSSGETKFKVTTNINKNLENKLFIDPSNIYDDNNVISFNCLKKIAEHLPIKMDEIKLELANKYVNEIRQKYLELYAKPRLENKESQQLKDLWKKEDISEVISVRSKAS